MRVDELILLLEGYPPETRVTVSDAPGHRLAITGHSAIMERDGGELCQPCEVTLLAGEAMRDIDLDRVIAA